MLNTTLLNRYCLDEPLGQGGMGIVYRGHDTLLKRPVAVKVLSKTCLSPMAKARLLSEAQSAAQLNHPNIVTIFDAGEVDETPFIVMELVPGETLRQYSPRSLADVLDIIDQVCASLEHAHAAGIIHRDLKLENVIHTPSGVVKLMDFGLARSDLGPRLTEDGALLGTFLYMAPELLMGQEAGVPSDLYALGVMFYELACGQPPFKGSDPLALISQHLNATPVPPSTHNPSIPADIETLILRLLSKQPDDRPGSAAEVRRLLKTESLPADAAAPASAPLDRVVRGRLVGRERELGEAIQLFRAAQQGESGILLISGEPGVGKSRLARELTVQVQIARGLALTGECYAEGGAPYAAFAQMILNTSAWPADLPSLVLADLIRLAPELRVRYPDVPPNPPLDPQAEQQRLYESVFTFFASLAASTPLVLLVEDVHWADGGSLALARSLARRFRQTRTPLLMVMTFREVELTENKGLSDLLVSWNRERVATAIKLRRLDGKGTKDLLEALFAEEVSNEFSDSIFRETEGNPFFIEEMCKALVESGQVYREKGSWQRRSTSSMEMPRSIRMAVEARLKCLPEASQEVLHLAAVLGQRFEFKILLAASERDEEPLIMALEDAEQAQLLNEVGRGGEVFEFAHALIPTTLMEGLSGMRRRRLHRRALAALEKLRPEDYKTLAFHCLQASEEERALDFLVKAANRARLAFANAEAADLYQQVIGLLNELLHVHEEQAALHNTLIQVYEDLGDMLKLTGQHEEACAAYRQASVIALPDDILRRSRLYRKTGKALEVSRMYVEAEALYQDAEAVLGVEPSTGLPEAHLEWQIEWLMAQLDRMQLYYWRGQVAEMAQLAESARPAIDQYGTPEQRSKFFCNLVLMRLRSHNYVVSEETLQNAALAVEAARQSPNLGEQAWAQFLLGFSWLWYGDYDRSETELLVGLDLLEKIGDMALKSRFLTYLTVTYRRRGEIDKVLSYAERSMETARVAQMIEYISMAQANQSWAARRQGRLQEAEALATAAWETMQKTVQSQMLGWIALWPLLGMRVAQERGAEAVELARLLLNPATQPQPESLAGHLRAAIACWEKGQPESADAYLREAVELAEPLGYL